MIRRVPIAAAIAVLGIAAATRSDIAASRAEASVAPASPRVRARVPTPARPVSSTATPPAQPDGAEGARLFVWYNCGDCHGAGGSGAMAPSLQDNRWHYGGSAGEVFRSIAEGRPGGMPAWGGIIPGPEMVALAAYVRSLGAGKDLSTENFTGTTIERSGH